MRWRRWLPRVRRADDRGASAAPPTTVRALRGAITVDRDEPDAIREATEALLIELARRNAVRPAQVISAIFTVTDDLRSAFPAAAARALGWRDVPLLCATEIPVPDALPRCVRVLLHVEWPATGRAPRHAYLGGAAGLRPELAETFSDSARAP
ncbi:MAG TPA: chorismate mutase [Gemmatimonadaceae bacterium]